MTTEGDEIKTTTEKWYQDYYKKKGERRNSLFHNPEVLFQSLAHNAAVISALRDTNVNPRDAHVLDVGCGGGGSLVNFMTVGFLPHNLWGIDIQDSRVSEGQKKFPNINFICGDASQMQFEDNNFDIVFESTMFMQLTDNDLSQKIASEMIRVTKTKGWIVLADWRYSKPFDSTYLGLSKKRIINLFDVEYRTQVHSTHKGPLVPPIGRFLSKNLPSLYFVIQALFPFLSGEMVTVLNKIA